MLRLGDHGSSVVALQEALIELGYHLPRWGVDGDFGTETLDAITLLMRDHKGALDEHAGTVSDNEIRLIANLVADKRLARLAPDSVCGNMVGAFSDVRAKAAQTRVYGRRAWKDITGITLHQTACVLGENPGRWETVGAHMGVTRAGRVIHMHDFDKLVAHGNGFNLKTVGVELDGEYAGEKGNLRTFWRPRDEPNRMPQTPTAELILAAKSTIRWICSEVARHGGKVKVLVPHRCSSGTRESDPGSEIWQAVALPMIEELGLSDGGAGFKIGAGRPIPESWDPAKVGIKY